MYSLVHSTSYYVLMSAVNDQPSTSINSDQSINNKKRGPEGPQL